MSMESFPALGALPRPDCCWTMPLSRPKMSLDYEKGISEDIMRRTKCENGYLLVRFVQDIELDQSPNCKGIWLDGGEFRRLLQ